MDPKLVIQPCVQCGYCCTIGPCSYSDWNSGRCSYLTPENLCSIYTEICAKERADIYPMFDCGCSSVMYNEVRDAKIKENKSKIKEGGLKKTCPICGGYMVYINDNRRVCEICIHVEVK
jgi:hypothetical protein